MVKRLTPAWTTTEIRQLLKLKAPHHIQAYLNALPYNDAVSVISPRRVLREQTAHCFEGALFAAAALRFLGHPPLIVDLAALNDDDHVIAVFRTNGLWGAIAKSNTTVLRFREPVYRSLRELVMSYFEMYFNIKGYKSLRSYSRPVNLARFDHRSWMFAEEDLEYIGEYLYAIPHISVLDTKSIRLGQADPELVRACFLGAKESGLFKPR